FQNFSRSCPASKLAPAVHRVRPPASTGSPTWYRPGGAVADSGVIAGHTSAPAERCPSYGRNMSAIPVRLTPAPRPIPGADIAPAAALMGDPARAAMLTALLDDRALAAGELAELAGVSPATASEHLTRLLGGGLVTVTSQGRHRYYRLAGQEVAAAIEALSRLSPPAPVRGLRQSRQA